MRFLVVIAFMLFAIVAAAEPAPSAKALAAKERYESGMAHFNLQEYAQAIGAFEEGYRLLPDPVFLFNLAQAHRLAEHSERALYFYRAYLRARPDAENRHEVELRIQALEKQPAALKPPPAVVPAAPAVTPAPATTAPSVSATTAPVAAAATSPTALTAPTDRPRRPLYKRWWLWTTVAVVAAGAAVGIAVGVTSQRGATFNANLGTVGPAALVTF